MPAVTAFLGVCATVSLRLVTAASVIGPTGELKISSQTVSPDGFQRVATLAGNDSPLLPGPVIRGKMGDHFSINVMNELTDNTLVRSTSVHWHGIHQTGSNWADGAAFVNQCPIAPQESFSYEFDVTSQAGTFWYHSHQSIQYCDGLVGPFIVDDPNDPYLSQYDVDDETTIITLQDWYHQTFVNGVRPLVKSTLINGLGRYVGGPASPLAVVNVTAGKRYRFRIIAMSCEPSFNFAIDNHQMTIIEADGEYTESTVVDNFQIHAGQRYSAIVTATQSVGNYWIRANPDGRWGATPGFDNNRNLAILRYAGAPVEDPTTTSTASLPLNEVDLHALNNPAAPGTPQQGAADVEFSVIIGLNSTSGYFSLNDTAYSPANTPILLQILNGDTNAQQLLPQGSIYPLPPNKVVEITIPGSTASLGGPHPFHLHGHSFSVVRSASSSTYNYANPVRRDTVSTGLETDQVTIRFTTDNGGPWILHCHMDYHFELGLAIVFAEDLPGTSADVHPPSSWYDLCPKYDPSINEGFEWNPHSLKMLPPQPTSYSDKFEF